MIASFLFLILEILFNNLKFNYLMVCHYLWHLLGVASCKNIKVMDVLQTIIYIVSFLIIFWLFFKSVKYFEKI